MGSFCGIASANPRSFAYFCICAMRLFCVMFDSRPIMYHSTLSLIKVVTLHNQNISNVVSSAGRACRIRRGIAGVIGMSASHITSPESKW